MSRQRRVMSARRPIPEKCKCPRVPKPKWRPTQSPALTVASRWSIWLSAGRACSCELGPRLHLSPRCRARPNVVPGLSRSLRAVGKAPLPDGQEGVNPIHTCHQEAKDLHANGNRKQKNNARAWVRPKWLDLISSLRPLVCSRRFFS